jgi:ribokinase
MPVIVFGSINLDLTTYLSRLPRPGETVTGVASLTAPGGKGANQAVCAARLGAPTFLIGRTGKDNFGEQVLQAVASESVNTSSVWVDEGSGTGLAVISVDEKAENTIILIPGANGRLDDSDVARAADLLDEGSVVMLQLETPIDASLKLATLARARGARVILDPAPAMPLPDELYHVVDLITPNEVETSILTGIQLQTEEDCRKAAGILLARGAETVVIKMGAHGAYYQNDRLFGFMPAFPVKAVDSVAAGDAFNAGLAVALYECKPLEEAIRWGAAAGAIACTRKGAIPSMPHRGELESLLGDVG